MRWQTDHFIAKFLQDHGFFEKVLEVGSRSLQVAGTLKHFFKGSGYVGLDMIKGDNVDIVLNAHDIKQHFKENSFDLVICFDTLEHDDKFWITLENMKWVLKPGGYLVIGVPSRRCPLHEFPKDYWRFMPESAKAMMWDMMDIQTQVDIDENTQMEDEVYFYARKPL